MCYEGVKGRRAHKGHFGYRPAEKKVVTIVGFTLRKRMADPEGFGAVDGLDVCQVLDALPALREMLVASHYPDGSPRVSSTLLVFVEAGVLKCCLNDRDQGQTAWASGSNLLDALGAIESGLQGDSLSWRTAGSRPGKKGGKRA